MAISRTIDLKPQIDTAFGIVRFDICNGSTLTPCMVTVAALKNRAARENIAHLELKLLFQAYRDEIEELAMRQLNCGIKHPVIRAFDLAPPPPLPQRKREWEKR